MRIAQPTGPELCASVDLTTRETPSFSATSTPASKAPAELTQIARRMDNVPSAVAEQTTLETPSLDAVLSHARQAPAGQTRTAHHQDKQLCANARPTMWVIPTPTADSIPARALPVDREQSAKTMGEQQFASALHSTLATHMFLVASTPASRMPVDLTLIVPEAGKGQFVLVDRATWARPTADLAAEPTLASLGSADQVLSARTSEADLSVSVFPATRATPTQDACKESVMRTPTVDLSGLARTTNVSTLVPFRVDKELTVPCRTM